MKARNKKNQEEKAIYAAIGGTWVLGGGIVLPCMYKIYDETGNRDIVRNMIETVEFNENDVQEIS